MLSLLALGVSVSACGTRPYVSTPSSGSSSTPSSVSSTTSTATSSPNITLPNAPACAPNGSSPSAHITITMSAADDSFSNGCYYAPANTPLTITFQNNLTELSDNSPITLRLVISPSNNPAYFGYSDQPHMFYGNIANASYVSAPVTGTADLSVPGLAPGIYDIQTNILRPLDVVATLTVS